MSNSKKATYPCTDLGDGIFDPLIGLKVATDSDDPATSLYATEAAAIELMRPTKEALEGKFSYPSPVRVKTLRGEQSKNARALDSELFHETWTEFIGVATDNPSLFAFEERYGFESRYFVPWQMRINLPVAREMAFGYGIDWDGRMVELDHLDPMFTWLLSDPLAIYLRERAVVIARALRNKKRTLCPSATRLALEHVGFDVKPPRIDLENDSPASDYDAIVLENALTFISIPGSDSRQLAQAIDNALNKLQIGGTLFFDICLDHWVYRRNHFVFGWNPTPALSTLKDAATVTDLIDQLIRNRPAVAKYHVDSRNDQPVAVLTSLTKVR